MRHTTTTEMKMKTIIVSAGIRVKSAGTTAAAWAIARQFSANREILNYIDFHNELELFGKVLIPSQDSNKSSVVANIIDVCERSPK